MRPISTISSITNLRSSFLVMSIWARKYNIKNFPSSLDSLRQKNPTDKVINNDINELNRFSKHPSYVYFRTGYLPVRDYKEN